MALHPSAHLHLEWIKKHPGFVPDIPIQPQFKTYYEDMQNFWIYNTKVCPDSVPMMANRWLADDIRLQQSYEARLRDKCKELGVALKKHDWFATLNFKDEESVASTITSSSKSLDISDNIIRLANVNPSGNGMNGNGMNGNVYGDEGVSPTLSTNKGEGIKIGAIRGRNPTNPLSRVSGLPTEQMLEINENGTSNALTTVQKDNVVVMKFERTEEAKQKRKESIAITGKDIGSFADRKMVGIEQDFADTILANPNPQKEGLIMIPAPIVEYQLTGGKRDKTHEQSGRVYDKNGIAPTIHTMGGGNQEPKVSNMQRIRRLTPREVFRLMDFNDDMIEKTITSGLISDSQLYKQGGNSICVGVLAAIIKNLKKLIKE